MKIFRLELLRVQWFLFSMCTALIVVPCHATVTSATVAPILFDDIFWFLHAAIFLCVALPLVPIIAYLWAGWEAKRSDIADGVSTQAKRCYLMMFSLSDYKKTQQSARPEADNATSAEDGCEKIFDDFYTRWYGRRHYLLPLVIFVAVLTYLSIHIAYSAATLFSQWKDPQPAFVYSLKEPALSAIAGAYLWVTSDFISRARRLDFAPSDLNWGTLRLIIAVPMGYAFARLTEPVGPSIAAFALGAFPLSAIQDMLRQTLYKWTTKTVPESERNDAVTRLQGVEDDIAIRMENEGITTIPQIAQCDPIRLVMRSNLTFNFVIDCMNQSLSWIYFEDQVKKMRPLGLRGAVEISSLMKALGSADEEKRAQAEATLADLTDALQPPHTEATLRHTFTQIADNPYTHFLRAVAINPFEPLQPPARRARDRWHMAQPGSGLAGQNGQGDYAH